jgi:hypothetical protein
VQLERSKKIIHHLAMVATASGWAILDCFLHSTAPLFLQTQSE